MLTETCLEEARSHRALGHFSPRAGTDKGSLGSRPLHRVSGEIAYIDMCTPQNFGR